MTRKLDQAVSLYKRFHQLEPRRVGEFPASFTIPREAFYVGEALQVLYRSDKLNPVTSIDEGIIDYFHDHEGGVRMYRCDRAGEEDGPLKPLPERVWKQEALTELGLRCLGFSYKNWEGHIVDGRPKGRQPELYAAPPNGKVLYVVEDKRRVVAIMLGGRLKVTRAGIEG